VKWSCAKNKHTSASTEMYILFDILCWQGANFAAGKNAALPFSEPPHVKWGAKAETRTAEIHQQSVCECVPRWLKNHIDRTRCFNTYAFGFRRVQSRWPEKRGGGVWVSGPNVSISALTQRAARVNQRETSRGTKLHVSLCIHAKIDRQKSSLLPKTTCNGDGKFCCF